MGIRQYKPTSPGRRFMGVQAFDDLTKGKKPERSLTEPLRKTGGRNHQGRITSFQRGGGHKRRYRMIDFKREKRNIPARVASIEYDPNRSGRIALLCYADGEKRYILAPDGLKVGATVISSDTADIVLGNALPLRNIPLGTGVYNVELQPGHGGQLARSAGVTCQLIAKEGRYGQMRLPSGEIRKVLLDCCASIGQVSNLDHDNYEYGKAGRRRWLGRRPITRGVAMNPVDHPLGGGEGRSAGGRHPTTPWGKPAKGFKTRKNKRTGRYIVRRRTKKSRPAE